MSSILRPREVWESLGVFGKIIGNLKIDGIKTCQCLVEIIFEGLKESIGDRSTDGCSMLGAYAQC